MMRRRGFFGLMASMMAPSLLRAQTTGQAANPARTVTDSLTPLDAAARLPQVPRVIDLPAMGRQTGRPGGSIRTLVSGQRDIRFMTINGYSRLVGYDASLTLQADVLESYETVEDRIFTFKLRPGHRWSDGSALSAEDFRYCWQDVLLNTELRPGGVSADLLSDGKPPLFEVIDAGTVRYTWESPMPGFLNRLAAPAPLVILMPAAYMKQFHKDYADPIRLSALVEQERVDDWVDLHAKMSRSYRPENPDLPTLDPWRNTTPPPAEQFTFVRNPYFHRVDQTGQQLPYIDTVYLNVSSAEIISAKSGAGESDLQMVGLDFVDYTYLKEAETRHPVKVVLWKRTQGARVALIPNLNCNDPVWRSLLQDVRFRRALSLAINRHEVNMVSFFGLGHESADTVLPGSALYKKEYATAWASFDPDQANALLDEAGLGTRDAYGLRLLPDGRPVNMIVESAGESTLETDILELITDHMRAVGIALFVRVSQRDVFRSRAVGGEIVMSVWEGLSNGVPTADMSPAGLAPTADDQLAWPLWGMHYYSRGTSGTPPDLPEVQAQLARFMAWQGSTSTAEREVIWRQMLEAQADQVFSIGIVNATLQPILFASRLRNMPEDGFYGFDPTSYLGVYMPDTFWLDEEA